MRVGHFDLTWNQFGTLSHTTNLNKKDEKLILGLSLPYLLSHQLGAYQISHGLIIVDQVLNYFIDGEHNNFVINNALISARLDYKFPKINEAILRFKPKKKSFSNSDSIEEGSRQLLNNFLDYVVPKYSELNRLTIMALCMTVLMAYEESITTLFLKKILRKSKLWHPYLSASMIQYGRTLSHSFNLNWWDNETEEKILLGKSNSQIKSYEIREKFLNLRKSLR